MILRTDRSARPTLRVRREMPRDRVRSAPGYTLLELLLVLALIVILYSLAVPSLKAPLATQRLKKAADQTCAEFATTRLRSMRSGQIHVIQIQSGAGSYDVKPWLAHEDLVEANDATMFGTLSSTGLAPSRTVRNETVLLPEGIVLVGSTTDDARSWVTATDEANLNEVVAIDASPIFFYPDGTTSSALVVLSDPQGNRISVTLRGLTGVARRGDIGTTEETLP